MRIMVPAPEYVQGIFYKAYFSLKDRNRHPDRTGLISSFRRRRSYIARSSPVWVIIFAGVKIVLPLFEVLRSTELWQRSKQSV